MLELRTGFLVLGFGGMELCAVENVVLETPAGFGEDVLSGNCGHGHSWTNDTTRHAEGLGTRYSPAA